MLIQRQNIKMEAHKFPFSPLQKKKKKKEIYQI